MIIGSYTSQTKQLDSRVIYGPIVAKTTQQQPKNMGKTTSISQLHEDRRIQPAWRDLHTQTHNLEGFQHTQTQNIQGFRHRPDPMENITWLPTWGRTNSLSEENDLLCEGGIMESVPWSCEGNDNGPSPGIWCGKGLTVLQTFTAAHSYVPQGK